MFYFAYGSNMNKKDLDDWCKRECCPLIRLLSFQKATLRDYEITFNYYSSGRKGGAANVMKKSGDFVKGVLFEANYEDMQKIREKEGAPNYYEEIKIDVKVEAGEFVRGVTTFKVVAKREDSSQLPTKEYKQIIIDGAKAYGLDNEWVRKLELFSTKD